MKVLTDREVSPQLGVLKSTLLQLDPTFSEREYGASTFRDLVQRLDRAGYVTLKGTDRNLYVELREGTEGAPAPREPEPAAAIAAAPGVDAGARHGVRRREPAPAPVASRREEPIEPDSQLAILPAPLLGAGAGPRRARRRRLRRRARHAAARPGTPRRTRWTGWPRRTRRRDGRDNRDGRQRDGGRGQGGQGVQGGQGGTPPPVADPALQADGYEAMERVFLKPGAVTRWPLYLRQAKAVLRAGDEGFDERKYGFAGLVEALRFGQREGLFRLDRDRQGVLRVYPGQLLQRAEGGGVMAGADAAPAHREPVMAAASRRRPRRVDERMDVAEPIEDTPAAASSGAGEAPAPAAKAAKRRGGAAKKPAAAKKAAPKARAAKAPAPRPASAPPRRPTPSQLSRNCGMSWRVSRSVSGRRAGRRIRERRREHVGSRGQRRGRGRRRWRARTSPSRARTSSPAPPAGALRPCSASRTPPSRAGPAARRSAASPCSRR